VNGRGNLAVVAVIVALLLVPLGGFGLMLALGAVLAGAAGAAGVETASVLIAPTPVNPSANQQLGKEMAAAAPYRWTGTQWTDLNLLWERESGWNNLIANPSSGAFGIAQALGHGETGTNGAGATGASGYVNPLSTITNLVPHRIDQGVDFLGSGPVLALGDGVVIETDGPGWPGGPFMTYRLIDGPDNGKVVYVAENISPLVTRGQQVTAGQPIATMYDGSDGIETGWADDTGTKPESQLPAAGSISGANLPSSHGGTAIGMDFEHLLISLGVPKASNFSLPTGGKNPKGYGDTACAGAIDPTVYYPGGSFRYNVCVNEYPTVFANAGNAVQQIAWGLNYILMRYGSPSAAWAHEIAKGWY
jgi:hypothetical protein